MRNFVQSRGDLCTQFVYGVHPVFSSICFNQRIIQKLFIRNDLDATGRSHELLSSQIPIKPINRLTVTELLNIQKTQQEHIKLDFVHKRVRPLVLFIDHLTDVMNFGSIVRSAVFFGASALLFSPSPCVAPSPLISKLSVGALESLPLYRLTDVISDLHSLKNAGFLIVGTAGNMECGKPKRLPSSCWSLTGDEVKQIKTTFFLFRLGFFH
ncbi:unnamed protein product [Echinostoma caproni]|uniref:SpoU_methylase domain-containing protein n=1 Tax=Echinostoma caproni TaxID=27848 RepID=A0A183AD52_9TREM|nr:unnamed protein product [Echinostoma caproni]